MTDRERAIVMAYTGTVMLCGDKLGVFYDYVSEKLGSPIFTHEFVDRAETIKILAKDDFLSLCAGKPYPKPKLRTPPEINITDEDGNVKWVLRLRKKRRGVIWKSRRNARGFRKQCVRGYIT